MIQTHETFCFLKEFIQYCTWTKCMSFNFTCLRQLFFFHNRYKNKNLFSEKYMNLKYLEHYIQTSIYIFKKILRRKSIFISNSRMTNAFQTESIVYIALKGCSQDISMGRCRSSSPVMLLTYMQCLKEKSCFCFFALKAFNWIYIFMGMRCVEHI